jgi:hypothetical protein
MHECSDGKSMGSKRMGEGGQTFFYSYLRFMRLWVQVPAPRVVTHKDEFYSSMSFSQAFYTMQPERFHFIVSIPQGRSW